MAPLVARSAAIAGPAVALLVLLVLVAPASAVAAPVADAGALRAEASEDPWGLRFTDPDGAEVLTEHPGTGLGPTGTLGFRTTAGWRHATRLVDSRREGEWWVAELATTDPTRAMEVRLRRAGEGIVALEAGVLGPRSDVSALGIGFRAREGERYLGFGERSNAVDQRGTTLETYVGEGPYQLEERPFITAFVPPWGYRQRDDASYYPMPWLLSTAGYGVLVDNTETTYHRLGTDVSEAWSLEVVAAPDADVALPAPERLRLRVFAGPAPADVVRRMSAAEGRQPPAAAPWFFGPWFQPTGDRPFAEVARELRAADAPVSVAQTYLHYLPCPDQLGRREAERERVASLHAEGVAVTTYFNPMICIDYPERYQEAAERGGLTVNMAGEPYVYRYSTLSQFLVSQFDFTVPAGREVFGKILAESIEDGHDGWMEDFGEYTPLDSRSANGMDGTEMHNLYPTLYHCAAHEFALRQPRPLARYVRSGYNGTAPCAPIVWGGDPTSGWGFDGLRSAVYNGLTMGLSGVSTWGSDIGGFFALGTNELTPELLVRWVQFGAVSGVMRTQAEGIAIPPKGRPQIWDEDQIGNWRRWAKLRTQLYPYLAGADAAYQRTGMPIMSHLALAYPEEPEAAGRDEEFLFGPDLLAAPVLEPDARERRLYLPDGHWVDLWRSARYRSSDGGLSLGAARLLRGGREATLPAPLEELPLLARAGAVIPLLPPEVDTLAEYGGDGLVHLSDREDRLDLLAFPRGTSRAALGAEGSLTSRERRRGWTLEISSEHRRTYELQASLATLERPFEPCAVELDGRALPARDWSHDAGRQTIEARFTVRHGRLVVRSSCREAAPARRPEAEPEARTERPDGTGFAAGVAESAPGTPPLALTGMALGLLALLGLLLAFAGWALRRERGTPAADARQPGQR